MKKIKPEVCLCLVLHAHLPYVRHPEYKDFLEEDWFFEALTETYLRLLSMIEALSRDGVEYKMAMSVTPTLMEMLEDPLLLNRYESRLENLCELARKEEERTRGEKTFHRIAWFYVDLFEKTRELFKDGCSRNLLAAFHDETQKGCLEILGSAATHAVLPLLNTPEACRAQVRTARRAYRRTLRFFPKGFWLPECAYTPGLDTLLAGEGIDYFFLESSSLLNASTVPKNGTRAPVRTPGGCFAFARDPSVSRQVWGSREGFPGHPEYREFYRDLAYDAELDYLAPYLHSDKVRRPLGIKYHRVTGKVPLYAKDAWDPDTARLRARSHAREFIDARLAEARNAPRQDSKPPLIVATFDAELFGHWWFEGPWFIEELFREIAHREGKIEAVTPGEWLMRYGTEEIVQPRRGTWGGEGSFATWLNPDNAWIWRHLHSAEAEMANAVKRNPSAQGSMKRVLNQALRELLLAQSSDWPFIMTRKTMVAYAVKRFRNHIHAFRVLLQTLDAGAMDTTRIEEYEKRHPFCSDVDYSDFS